MKYVLLFVDTEQFANDLQAMGPAERERAYQRVEEWFANHAGTIRGGSKLRPPETATTVRLDGAEPVITDGPFVEGKEVVSGYAEIQIGDSVVIVEDESPEQGSKAPPPGGVAGSPSSLFIYVEDVDAVVARAVELGATLQRPPQNQFYGDRDAFIIDPYGHGWTVASHVEDVSPEEAQRRMMSA